ncbi:efflux RND transporter permease subunit [Pyruvatibacter sp.]|uniref:efflux RND transporter permease subunit n=1 Tax=Pyruvatibacter sp. TaxID=1981328 RepID=UPI003263F109
MSGRDDFSDDDQNDPYRSIAAADRPRGILGFFVVHRNAANLLMGMLVVAGLYALTQLNTQFFPRTEIPTISVVIAWPGASAEDVEGNIIEAIEPEVRFLDGVDSVDSYAREGVAQIVVEFASGADMQKAQADIEQAVSSVTTLPQDSERAVISRFIFYESVAALAISGPFTESALRAYAKDIRDELLNSGVDRVVMKGVRDPELIVEVSAANLRRLDLSVADVSARIRQVSQDLPSGTLEGAQEKQLRSMGLATDPTSLGAIEIKSLAGGEKVRLQDIADIRDGFDESQPTGLRSGQLAMQLDIQRAMTADTLDVQANVEKALAGLTSTLPPTLKVEMFNVQADLVFDRIMLLVKNGVGGLLLVLAILFVFLNARVAFWVSAGIPVAMMATLAVMLATGQSINMISLFALIMTIGIIVDDAIVVGEHATTLREQGHPPAVAAYLGGKRMFGPVFAAILTTVAAFAPILLIGDIIGQILRAMPLVVMAVMVASLVECFLVLPGHMHHALEGSMKQSRFHAWFNAHFARFRDGPFRRIVAVSFDMRYTTLAIAAAAFIICIGLMQTGRVGFQFFPSPEGETVDANVIFAPGTPRETTQDAIEQIDAALERAVLQLAGEDGVLVQMSYGTIGETGGSFSATTGDNQGSLQVELVASELRSIRTRDLVAAWRAELPVIPGVERIALKERRGGPPGRDLDVRLTGGDPRELKAAALEVRDLLATFDGVSDIEDDLPYGKQELILEVNPRGAALGFTTETVGRQVRNSFEGSISKRFARDDEEVTIRVQLPDAEKSRALEDLFLRTDQGREVPLTEVVSIREQSGFSRLRREDGKRFVSIAAEVDALAADSNAIIRALPEQGLADIAAKYNLQFEFAGRAEEQGAAFADLGAGTLIALIAIYIILAWVFASYARPIVVMSIIPFGLVGAVLGHLVMGFDLTILSFVALLGLAGILVNDSIILVDQIDNRLDEGMNVRDAVINGVQDRLRAVLLTSLTTVGGLTPLLFETSLQAQFLLPMAITLAFGLATATFLVLLVVPAILGIQEDARALFGRKRSPRIIDIDAEAMDEADARISERDNVRRIPRPGE